MAKYVGQTISVLKDSNRVVANSDVDWSGLREGAYFRIDKQATFHIVSKVKKIYFIKDFTVLDTRTIQLKDDISINLLRGDTLKISYKEHELLSVFGITSGGHGYKVGDVVKIHGGSLAPDIHSNIDNVASFLVDSVNHSGEIQSISLQSKGKYVQTPPNQAEIIGGNGSGAVFEVEYQLLDNRKVTEKTIEKIIFDESGTKIVLDYPLPKGVLVGKLSVEKWEVILNSNYLGETAIDVPFQVSQDFTSNLKLPLMAPGSLSTQAIYNQSMQILESKIMELEAKIAALSV